MPHGSPIQTHISLVATEGPTLPTLALTPPGPLTIGRRTTCTLLLEGDERVSREHAHLVWRKNLEGGAWSIVDNHSKHGTRLNRQRLTPDQEYPLHADDIIEIAPWSFRVLDPASPPKKSSRVQTDDDLVGSGSTIARIDTRLDRELAGERLALLLRCADRLHAASTEVELAESVIDAAMAGTRFSNAAVLQAMAADGTVEIVAHRSLDGNRGGLFKYSRSLISRAAHGVPVRLAAAGPASIGASVLQLGILEALCVPLLVDSAVAGFLYLDERGNGPLREIAPDAAEFAVGLARLAALAKANLARLDLFRRQAQMEADLTAAGNAQRLILPAREGQFGQFSWVGESRPGRWVGGDFFDVIPLPDGRLAVTLGDVSGKGISASVLMTVAQGYLHAALSQTGDVALAVAALNSFLSARRAGDKFLTLWAGMFDPATRQLEFVDGGHGYAFLLGPDGAITRLTPEGGTILGIDASSQYRSSTMPLQAGSRLVVVSDGMIEQSAPRRGEDRAEQFGADRLISAASAVLPGGDVVEHLFASVDAHASGLPLGDDATAVCINVGS